MTLRPRQLLKSGCLRTVIATLFVPTYLFPVYWMIATSLKSRTDIFATPPKLLPVPVELNHYRLKAIGWNDD